MDRESGFALRDEKPSEKLIIKNVFFCCSRFYVTLYFYIHPEMHRSENFLKLLELNLSVKELSFKPVSHISLSGTSYVQIDVQAKLFLVKKVLSHLVQEHLLNVDIAKEVSQKIEAELIKLFPPLRIIIPMALLNESTPRTTRFISPPMRHVFPDVKLPAIEASQISPRGKEDIILEPAPPPRRHAPSPVSSCLAVSGNSFGSSASRSTISLGRCIRFFPSDEHSILSHSDSMNVSIQSFR